MSDQSPILGMPFIQPSQAQKHVTHNEAIQRLDAVVQLGVISRSIDSPPGVPVPGERYIIGSGAAMDWAGHDGELTYWDGVAWLFFPPEPGWQAYVQDEDKIVVFDGLNWSLPAPDLGNVSQLGIGTGGQDDTHRLAVVSAGSWFSHNGNHHRLKINKAAPQYISSLLLLSNWSARAELGLVGDNDLHLRTSSDGSTWNSALRVRNDTGMTEVTGLMSGKIVVPNNNIATISPPSAGGFILISIVNDTYPQNDHSGIFVYDCGASPALHGLAQANKMTALGTSTLTGTTGSSGDSSLAVAPGQLLIENRFGSAQTYSYTFIGGY